MTSAAPGLDEGLTGSKPSSGAGWAIALLSIFALFDGLVLALLIFAGEAVGAAFRVLTALGVGGALAIALAVVIGLAQDRRWGRPAAVGILWILVISGGIDVVAELGAGRLTIPFLAIAALAILASWHRSAVAPGAVTRPMSSRDRWVSAILVGGFVVVVLVWPAMLSWLAIPGNSPLAVTASSVEVDATLDCQAFAGAVGGTAANASQVPIPASLGWRWSQHEYLPGGTDSLAIRWKVALPDGSGPGPLAFYLADAAGYHADGSSTTLDASPDGPFTVGLSTADTSLADRLVGATLVQGFPVSIDVAEQRLRDDRFTFRLRASDDPPVHGTLTVEGFYVHQNKWSAGPAIASCSW